MSAPVILYMRLPPAILFTVVAAHAATAVIAYDFTGLPGKAVRGRASVISGATGSS